MHTANAVLAALALLCARARSLSTLLSSACERYLGARVSGRGAAATRIGNAAEAPRAARTPAPAPAGPAAAAAAGAGFDALQEKAWNAASEGAAPCAGVRPVRAAGLLALRASCNVACRTPSVTTSGTAGRQTAQMASAAAARRTERTLALAGAPWAPTVLRGALPVAPAATCAAEDPGRHVNVLAVRTRGPRCLRCSAAPAGRAAHIRQAARRWVCPLPGPAGRCMRAAQVRRACSQRCTLAQPRPLRGSAAAPPLPRSGAAVPCGPGRAADVAGSHRSLGGSRGYRLA